ncbi:uncharacterized protein LOC141627592 [Silene latifolia]|uniref:uncharacterized protein LOC141627592 n=1 Tax=Silene latifolia TaxID=37657 RepID=UPI003D76DB3C
MQVVYDILRKSQKFEWTEEHEKAFKELKCYLSTPPLLAKPEQREPLFLYLLITEVAVSVVLVKEQDGIQHPVYYILTSYPLKIIMRKPELLGRMTKLSVHLSGYDLQFEPRTAIKSQALAYFVSDFCPATQAEAEKRVLTLCGNQESDTWTLYIDGASNAQGARVGLMARGLNVKNLRVYSDSLLVITQIPRDQNVEADALATLGATFKPTELSSIRITHVLTPTIQQEEEQDEQERTAQAQHVDGTGILVLDEDQQVGPDWQKPYVEWLRDGSLPEDSKEAQSFRIKASRFVLIDNVLFKNLWQVPTIGALTRRRPAQCCRIYTVRADEGRCHGLCQTVQLVSKGSSSHSPTKRTIASHYLTMAIHDVEDGHSGETTHGTRKQNIRAFHDRLFLEMD